MADRSIIPLSDAYPQRDEDGRDPDPDDEREAEELSTSEARRRTAARMNGIESVDEMMSRRALPPAEGE